MLTNEDKLWIEKAIRDAHEKSDDGHKEDHSEIKEILQNAMGRFERVVGGVAIAVTMVILFFPVDIITTQ